MRSSTAILSGCAVAFLVLFAFASRSYGQMPVSSSTTSTPVPGAGHDYLGSIADTVNPANGSVSLRINATVPSGRGLTLPFAFAYDSNGVNYVSTPNASGTMLWSAPSATIVSTGGWSETVPVVSVTEITWTAHDDSGHPSPCYAYVGYVYQDPQGNRHNLNLSTYSGSNPSAVCSYDTTDWPPEFTGSVVTSSGEDGWSPAAGAILASIPAGNGAGASAGPVTVSQPDGTTFYFPNSSEEDASGAVPSSVEDRNGNIIQITPSSSYGYTYTDTLGRSVISDSGFGTSPEVLTVQGYNGHYSINWTPLSNPSFSIPVTTVSGSCPTAFGHAPLQGPIAFEGVSTLTLPNDKGFSFSYDPTYQVVNKMVYPSGGYVRYVWGVNSQAEWGHSNYPSSDNTPQCVALYGVPAITDRYVSFNGTTEPLHQHFAYSTTWNLSDIYAPRWTVKTTTVTTTDSIRSSTYKTVYAYSPAGVVEPPNTITPTCCDPVEQSVAYYDTSGALLKTVYKTWQNLRLLTSEETQFPSGVASETTWTYNSREQEIERDDYDFGTSGVGLELRRLVTNYQQFNDTPLYANAPSIVDRPCQIITYDGSGNRYAETDAFYDNGSAGTPCGTAGTPSVAGAGGSSLTGHDESGYGVSSSSPRGNITTMVKQCFPSSACAAGNPTTTYTYDETGQVLSMKDPNANTTSYSYTDNFVSTNSGGFTTTAGDPPSGKVTDAYLTKITMPTTSGIAHVESFAYGYNDGELTESIDQNSQQTTYKYNDLLGRLTETDYPDGGQTLVTYNDSVPSISTSKKINATQSIASTTVMDGLGHAVQTQLTSDPLGTTFTATNYDGNGRSYQAYNPTRCNPPTTNCGSATWGVTTYTYDALGRTIQVVNPDSSTRTISYSGRANIATDEGNGNGNVQSVSQVDGLGHLTSVCEVTGTTQDGITPTPQSCGLDITATGFLTSYSYDPLGNLLAVSQGGLNGRSFGYDSLSRLASATNPESGTVGYAYDGNGNLITRIAPEANQTSAAKTTTTGYTYDALNRLTSKTYSHSDNTAASPPVYTFYDLAHSWGGVSISNSIGRAVQFNLGNNISGFVNSYDPMGRVINQWQCTPVDCGITSVYFTYTYDLLGEVLTANNNADDVTYTDTYDTAGNLLEVQSSLSDSQHPGTLITLGDYSAMHNPLLLNLGNGLAEGLAYTNRGWNNFGQLYNSAQQTLYSFTLGFAPDGDVTSANDAANGNWTYTYGALNRIMSGACSSDCPPTTSVAYGYDRFGNRWTETITGTGYQPSYSFNANNQIIGMSYDAAGNTLNDGVNSYTYDDENRIASMSSMSNSASYVYDPQGTRVRSVVNGQNYDFFHDLSGRTVTQLTNNAWSRSEAYAGNRHIATYANGTTEFDSSDWLSTFRVRTNVSGGLVETCSSLPFGEDLTCTVPLTSEVSPLHFTGKERDSESGLDNFGARYNASTMGRFMTPDPLLSSGRPNNPQTWNRYAYALNNPLAIIDPTGLYNLDNTCAGDDKKCNKQFQQDSKNLKQGISDLQKKVDNMKDGPEKTRLEASLKALGTENDGNNVNVKFGALAGSAAGNTETVADKTGGLSFNVTFDPSKISGGTNSWAIDAAHEGTHVSDISDPRYASDATTLSPFQLEYRGYQTSAWAAQTLGVSSLSFGGNVIWNSSWGAVDRQTLMDHGITNHVTSIPGHPEPQPPTPHNPWPN